jgi:hypothetical protein
MMAIGKSAFQSSAPFGSDVTSETDQTMRIYMFKSETQHKLQAFAGDLLGSQLPERHGPWTAIGAVGPDSAPPHHFSRAAIEKAIGAQGFQLWRLCGKAEARN